MLGKYKSKASKPHDITLQFEVLESTIMRIQYAKVGALLIGMCCGFIHKSILKPIILWVHRAVK
jgi:hypothetical protein